MNVVEELKNLDVNDVGRWPFAFRIAVIVIVFVAVLGMGVYWFIIEDKAPQLQRSRPEIVHLFDEMTRQLPEGVYLTGMRQNGVAVELMGIAQSSTRVSALMRQVDSSEWLTDPGVIKVETTETGPSRRAEFVVNLKQISHDDAGLEDEQ